MKNREELKEIKLKSAADLQKILNSSREKLRELRFKVSQNQLKNVREIRFLNKKVARIMTVLNQKKKETVK